MSKGTSAWTRFWAVMLARNSEFLRDRSALAWNFLFPIIVIIGFAFIFTGKPQPLFKVAIVAPVDEVQTSEFLRTEGLEFVRIAERDEALNKLRRHVVDFVIEPATQAYWSNSTSPKGYLAEKLLLGSERQVTAAPTWKKGVVEGREIRYVDWLVSGLLGMNMMFSALFGVGYNIVRYRKNGVLKRLKATPLRPIEFLSAQVVSRLLLIQATAILVYTGCNFFIHFRMEGSYVDLFITLTIGAICLISLGLLVACRTASEELGGGLLNLITWPMMFLSGVWFSLEGAHPWVLRLADLFPLTHFIGAARAIMTEGATLAQVSPQLAMLAALSAIFLALGSWLFKWQ